MKGFTKTSLTEKKKTQAQQSDNRTKLNPEGKDNKDTKVKKQFEILYHEDRRNKI